MLKNTYVRSFKNRSYISEDITPLLCEDGRFRFIYKITCIPTDKFYYGMHIVTKTVKDPLKDNYRGGGIVLKRAKQKYDWYRDFKFEIVEFAHSEQHLRELEVQYIEPVLGDPKCYNIASCGRGGFDKTIVDKWVKSTEFKKVCENSALKRKKRVLVVFDFTSPLNNKFFKAGTIFESAKEASRSVGYKARGSIAVLMARDYHPGQWWMQQKGGLCFVTAFEYVENDYNLTDIQQKHSIIKTQFYEKFKQDISKTQYVLQNYIAGNVSKPIKVINEFVSPFNDRHFKKDEIFKSATELAYQIGFKTPSCVTSNIMNHKSHPGEWWIKKRGTKSLHHIATFVYIDTLENK